MKKVLIIVAIILAVLAVAFKVFAGGVTDNNNGNLGNIFVSTGENNGANSVGTWVDSSSFKGEKGDKGDKGDTGATGEQGVAGQDGVNGVDGQNGTDGINGENGQDGRTPVKGEDYNDGKDGQNGSKGEQGVKGDTGKGLKNPIELQLEGVIKEGSRNAFSAYFIHDFNNDIDTIGLKWKHYFGKSYTEQVREDLQNQINELKQINNTTVPVDAEVYQDGTSVGIRSKF